MKPGKNRKPAAGRLPEEKNEYGGSVNGSITIYLTLTLIIILVLICTLIESGRVSAVSGRLRSITYMGMDSVFSEFAQPVFETYGVMGLWKTSDEFINEFTEYTGYNLDTSDISYSANADFYGMSLSGVSLGDITYITDDNGLIFAEQVYEYMNYYLAQSAAQELLESLDIFGQSDTVSEFMEKIESYSEVFTEVEEKVSLVKEAIEAVQNLSSNPSDLLAELYNAVTLFTDNDVSTSEFSNALTELKNAKSTLTSALEDIQDSTSEYYESVEEAKEAASELEDSLLEEADGLDQDIYESLEAQVNELKEKSADTDADYYSVGANEDTTEEYISMLESLEDLFSGLSDTLTEENAQEYLEIIAQYQELFEDFDLSELGVNFDTSVVDTEDSSILSYISNLVNKGVLAYVKDDVSEKTLETDDLPSVTVDSSDPDSEESIAQATLNKVIFGQYVLDYFGNAVDTLDDTALDYEVEYIIGGNDSDLANLKVVVNELVALRSGLNFISILKDSAKKNEAYTLATAMVGFTGMPLLITVFQMLILTAWSAAEAITDVKSLLDGQKVPTIKSSAQWNLSIEDFKNFTGKNLESTSYESGLEYEDYLRVLLAVQGRQKQYFRTMDMIQADMCLNENEDFRLEECIVGVQICAQYTAAQLFTSFGFVSSNLESSGGTYSFSIEQFYEY